MERFVCVDNYQRILEPSLEWWAILAVAVWAAMTIAAIFANRTITDPASSLKPALRKAASALTVVMVVSLAASAFGPIYRPVFITTLILTSGTVIFALAIGLSIALLVSLPRRGKSIYRVFLIWPFAISPPVAGILFFVMFDPVTGIVAHAYELMTPWELPNYRTDATLARILVIIASVWKILGFIIVFYIAGLQNVSVDMLNAARIDGANAFQRLWHLVIPALSPITFFLIITTVTYAFFEIFGTINYLTGGGPDGATTDAMTSVWLSQEWIGEGAVRSLILFIMVLAVTAWQFRASGKKVHYGK